MTKGCVKLRLPNRIRKAEPKGMNPFFMVDEVPLVRIDNHEETGLKGLFNHETNNRLGGSVAYSYQVTTHQKASETVRSFLDKIGLAYETDGGKVSSKGSRFYENITLPGLNFNPAKMDSSALDASKTPNREDIIPMIIIRNSYDKTAPVGWTYGMYRLLCSNGMAMPLSVDSLMYRHNQDIDFEMVQSKLMSKIDESITMMTDAYKKLNSVSGITALKAIMEAKDFTDKFKLALVDNLQKAGAVTISSKEVIEDKEKFLEIEDISTDASAWGIYNMATDISSHVITDRSKQDRTDRRIMSLFGIGESEE